MADIPNCYMYYVRSLLEKIKTKPTSHVNAFGGKYGRPVPPPSPTITLSNHSLIITNFSDGQTSHSLGRGEVLREMERVWETEGIQ